MTVDHLVDAGITTAREEVGFILTMQIEKYEEKFGQLATRED
jgi:hypothetical protein